MRCHCLSNLRGFALLLVLAAGAGCNDNGPGPKTVAAASASASSGTELGPAFTTRVPVAAGIPGRMLFATDRSDPSSYATTFPLNQTLDLNVLIAWQGNQTHRVTQVSFYSPDGRRFSQLTAPRSSLDMQPLDGGETGFWAFLPVGGTAISSRGLAGTWRVAAQLDDGVSSFSSAFVLVP